MPAIRSIPAPHRLLWCSSTALLQLLTLLSTPSGAWSFLPASLSPTPVSTAAAARRQQKLYMSDDDEAAFSIPPETVASLEQIKDDLIRCCTRSTKPLLDEVQMIVRELEDFAEQVGIGQASSVSGLMNGEWELLYSPEDETRASPFFWAFRKAYPTNADQIFAITDAIPAPVKEVGPAYQQIDFSASSQTGNFISRVKVATLGGLATSMMTTRGQIVKAEGLDGLRLKIETTKPEDSTIVKTLFGPLANTINENAPAFPSGEALEKVQPGSSEVVMRTTFCDESLRISRNDDRFSDVFVWKRRSFASFEPM